MCTLSCKEIGVFEDFEICEQWASCCAGWTDSIADLCINIKSQLPSGDLIIVRTLAAISTCKHIFD